MTARVYSLIFNHGFVHMNPEVVHHLVFTGISWLGRTPGLRSVTKALLAPYAADPVVTVFGRPVPAPFGLAAGFDKDARAAVGLAAMGFGFVEVGTITAQAQPGNEKPRLWRELDVQGLRNRMGFNNEGAPAAAVRLARLRATRAGRETFVGVNIGKTKVTPAADAAADYATSATLLAPFADYLVVNVSSPNTPGLRDLQSTASLRPILTAVRRAADDATAATGARRVPLLVKIAPDLSDDDIVGIAALVTELGVDGVVAVNTTIDHSRGPGGLSGPPERERGLAVVRLLRSELGDGPVIIGCGGITTAADAWAYRDAGADLVQGYTGFIYQGPLWAHRINTALVRGRR